ncbi:MAG: 2-oxoglutarate dehydrogenase E1 component [Granulosicoccus sp.]|jgi:2-oxoglutarate dehydrogenase E1 component
MDAYSYLSNMDVSTVEHLYQTYKKEPLSVSEDWQQFFAGFDFAQELYEDDGAEFGIPANVKKEFDVMELINGYRKNGHLFTHTNPVRERRKYSPTLDIENFGLAKEDLETTFRAGQMLGMGPATLREIIATLEATYCQSIGCEYMYIRRPEVVEWMQKLIEANQNQPEFSIDQKKTILNKLNQAVVFEQFLGKKFTGQKRFSLEGAESLIPALDVVVEEGSSLGIEEFVIGMAHRGRLNVLANTMHKTYKEIFSEFEGKDYEDDDVEGDVKYHLGYTSYITCDSGKEVKMNLCPNPSHLEAVDPVVEGISRAKIDRKFDGDNSKLCPILIHGDAAISGQGVVYEIVQMAKLDGYKTGGTIHIVINNQVGFTTNYIDGRSSIYCTDVAKVTLSPVFHVNGDDVEAVARTMKMAMQFRQTFKGDVFIDLLCYRKYGHNEGDEPRFTQPNLYDLIANHQNPLQIYSDKLMSTGVVEQDLAKQMEQEFGQMLQERLVEAKQIKKATVTQFLEDTWEGYRYAEKKDFESSPETGVARKSLENIATALTSVPEGLKLFRKMKKILNDRKAMVFETDKLDWGMAELLAYGSVMADGHPVRISGQDVERGTFSHRHAVLKVEDSGNEYIPLNNMANEHADLQIYNSFLSEYAVLGFDYGYAFGCPNALTIWEAQFGDFNNGAQIIIDQFISSAEEKWKGMNGLVMLLPHGYEGMGAEHSSARMERFLLLCADDNMQMVNCSTPANFFHVLRRQMKREFRKPLVVFTPKSLLRHPRCTSSVSELSEGRFQEVIDDATAKPKKVKRVVMCSGKVYYDLLERKEELKNESVALVRLEQLDPLPRKQLDKLQDKYGKAEWIWLQEEPLNMGAWSHLLRKLRQFDFEVIGRPTSGAPATGSGQRHRAEQKLLVDKAFADI